MKGTKYIMDIQLFLICCCINASDFVNVWRKHTQVTHEQMKVLRSFLFRVDRQKKTWSTQPLSQISHTHTHTAAVNMMTGVSSQACVAHTVTLTLGSAGGKIPSQRSFHRLPRLNTQTGHATITHIPVGTWKHTHIADRVCVGALNVPKEVISISHCASWWRSLYVTEHSKCHMTPAQTETSGDRAMND